MTARPRWHVLCGQRSAVRLPLPLSLWTLALALPLAPFQIVSCSTPRLRKRCKMCVNTAHRREAAARVLTSARHRHGGYPARRTLSFALASLTRFSSLVMSDLNLPEPGPSAGTDSAQGSVPFHPEVYSSSGAGHRVPRPLLPRVAVRGSSVGRVV